MYERLFERKDTKIIIRTSSRVKRRFQALFYLLKSRELIDTQDELLEAVVEIWERYPELLKKVLRREFK